eukprot:SAG31_NODE_12430_length_942_cov_5.460261_1_plen_37_part_10
MDDGFPGLGVLSGGGGGGGLVEGVNHPGRGQKTRWGG